MNDRTNLRLSAGTRATRIAAASLVALAAFGAAAGPSLAAKGGSGSIWTTDAPCTVLAAQNQNLYAIGDTVYVRGENFGATVPFTWTIAGLPGGASGDPGATVASGGPLATAGDGTFCLAAYVVAANDWGVYTVDVTQGRTSKNDNYRVDRPTDTGPTDTGPTDTGPTDTGPTDTGPTDNSTVGPSNGSTDNSTVGPSNGSTDEPNPAQSVQGDAAFGLGFELPATDTVSDAVTGGSSLLLILGLAGLAGAAVLFAPSRRREPEATE